MKNFFFIIIIHFNRHFLNALSQNCCWLNFRMCRDAFYEHFIENSRKKSKLFFCAKMCEPESLNYNNISDKTSIYESNLIERVIMLMEYWHFIHHIYFRHLDKASHFILCFQLNLCLSYKYTDWLLSHLYIVNRILKRIFIVRRWCFDHTEYILISENAQVHVQKRDFNIHFLLYVSMKTSIEFLYVFAKRIFSSISNHLICAVYLNSEHKQRYIEQICINLSGVIWSISMNKLCPRAIQQLIQHQEIDTHFYMFFCWVITACYDCQLFWLISVSHCNNVAAFLFLYFRVCFNFTVDTFLL